MALKLLPRYQRLIVMTLAPLETEIIDLFVHVARLLNIPKSVAEIYGLLFIAPTPLSPDEIIARLMLSKGAVSQGLRLLRNLGAVRAVYVPGKRSDHFEAEVELRKLVSGVLKDKLEPHFHDGSDRLQRMQSLINELPTNERERVSPRLDKLRSWQKAGQRILPLVRQCLA